ncbi:MAG TPA: DUF4124 domain-containing protein [Gammaproteobacteria bacterium]|nr:DUF4124 domain-containing protein [Gammaproteobacteria bacterium]
MRLFLILLILLIGNASAEVYKRVNPDGSVEFSDVPGKQDDKPVPLRPMSTFTPPPVPPPTSTPQTPSTQAKYTELRITSPANEASIRENSGTLKVSVAVKPGLQSGHRLVLLLDGAAKAESTTGDFTLKNVDRGEHTLSAQVVDAQGKVLISAPSVSIYLHRFSAIRPKGAK